MTQCLITQVLDARGDAFDLGMVGHRRPVLQRSIRRAGCELTASDATVCSRCMLLLQAFHIGVAEAAERPLLQLVVTAAVPRNALGTGARIPGGVRGGARRDRHGALQPDRLVQGARAAGRRKAGRGGGSGAHQARRPASRRRYRPTRILRRHRWEVGAGYGVYNRQNLVTAYGDFGLTDSIDVEFVLQQALGTLDNRFIATIGLRHTFIPEWKWFSPTAGLGTAYQHIVDKVPPAPFEKQQRDGLRLAWRPRLHHPPLHVARRLASLRGLQQLERIRGTRRMESRLCSVLLAAALLSGCGWFHRGDKKPVQVSAEDPERSPPSWNRRSRGAR